MRELGRRGEWDSRVLIAFPKVKMHEIAGYIWEVGKGSRWLAALWGSWVLAEGTKRWAGPDRTPPVYSA